MWVVISGQKTTVSESPSREHIFKEANLSSNLPYKMIQETADQNTRLKCNHKKQMLKEYNTLK